MPHFRQDPLIQTHLQVSKGSFIHTYKGAEYQITSDIIDDLPDEVVQSLSTRLSKIYPRPKPKPKPVRGKGKASSSGSPGTDEREVIKDNKELIIERELRRLATTEVLVEDKLNYPRVFMKLLSQPHLALEEKRLVPEDIRDLYMYVDESVGYNDKDDGFHYTLIKVAKRISGIKIFASNRLLFPEGYYWQHMQRHVPKGKKVLVFTQGCGGTTGIPPKGYDVHFCTHFEKGRNCGCPTIRNHESYDKLFHFHYGLDVPEKLKSLNVK